MSKLLGGLLDDGQIFQFVEHVRFIYQPRRILFDTRSIPNNPIVSEKGRSIVFPRKTPDPLVKVFHTQRVSRDTFRDARSEDRVGSAFCARHLVPSSQTTHPTDVGRF